MLVVDAIAVVDEPSMLTVEADGWLPVVARSSHPRRHTATPEASQQRAAPIWVGLG